MKKIKNPIMTIALPSGRLFKSILNMLKESGYFGLIDFDEKNDRRLIFYNQEETFQFIITKPKDNPTYVECGAADMGIAGKDILLEEKKDVYELLDLGLGKCSIVLAASRTKEEVMKDIEQRLPLKIATKYPNISRNYCLKKGIHGKIITLYGSIELAPQVGLSDIIVDLVSTGKTLRQNHLAVIEEIAPISARLITNRISYKTKHRVVHQVVQILRKAVGH
ncbi:MAG: ATP phosphoribosyltransferase [Elusimicrobiota bacterium]